MFTNYETLESDETHEAKDGYEWKKITATITFTDENVITDGWWILLELNDYYSITAQSSDNPDTFTVNYNGIDYTECVSDISYEEKLSEKKAVFQIYQLLPIGYDGSVVGFLNWKNQVPDGQYFYDYVDEDSLFFRMD